MIAQMRYVRCFSFVVAVSYSDRTILLAGHETSAVSMCWVLYELARHPDVQKRLRKEIRDVERAVHARGHSDFTAADLDNMPYLTAVIKVDLSDISVLPLTTLTADRNQCVSTLLSIKTTDNQ